MSKGIMASTADGGQRPMETTLWFVGFFVLYFAMQLWILPKLGINT